MKKTFVFGMVLIAMVVYVSSAAAQDTVTRDLPESAGAGTTITVDLTVDVETTATFYAIDEVVPSGWSVTSATGGGDYTSEPGHVKWVVTSNAADTVYSYTVDIPADAAGTYTFDGTYAFEGMADEATILGDTGVLVGDGAADTVTRDLPESAGAGTPITVDLTVDVETTATFYAIDEVVPSGWSVTSATGGGDYTSEPGHVKWVLTSGAADTVYSYTVDIPADAAGTYTFDGTYAFEGMADEATILGDTEIRVDPPESPGNEVYFNPQRSIAEPNETARVEIRVNANNSFQSGQLNITYPAEYANVTEWALNTENFSMGRCTLTAGRAWITFVASGPLTGDHAVGTLTIQRVEEACHTAQFVFVEPSLLCDNSGQAIEVEWNDGIFTCDGVCGDVREDGVVDIKDVTLLLNHVNCPFAYPLCEWRGDVTGDGVIDIRDVTLLLNHVNNPDDCPLCCR